MGYNANLTGVGIITRKKAAAGIPVLHLLIARTDQRITIPYLRVKAGASGGPLTVLQTEGVFRFRQGTVAGDTLTMPAIPAGVTDRSVVLRFANGDTVINRIHSQTGETITLDTAIPGQSEGLLFLLGSPTSVHSSTHSLTASGSTVLQGECPGVIAGKELGWPLGLQLENSDGNAEIEGGTIAYISV